MTEQFINSQGDALQLVEKTDLAALLQVRGKNAYFITSLETIENNGVKTKRIKEENGAWESHGEYHGGITAEQAKVLLLKKSIPFSLPANFTSMELQTSIQNYIEKKLGIPKYTREYGTEFHKWYAYIRKLY